MSLSSFVRLMSPYFFPPTSHDHNHHRHIASHAHLCLRSLPSMVSIPSPITRYVPYGKHWLGMNSYCKTMDDLNIFLLFNSPPTNSSIHPYLDLLDICDNDTIVDGGRQGKGSKNTWSLLKLVSNRFVLPCLLLRHVEYRKIPCINRLLIGLAW